MTETKTLNEEGLRELHTEDCLYVKVNGACDCDRGPVITAVVESIVSLIEARAEEWTPIRSDELDEYEYRRGKRDAARELAKQIGEMN